jgi:hypothetical protein
LNFEAFETSEEVDQQFKIDVIAIKEDEVQAIQVKKGQISSQEIYKDSKKGMEYLQENYPSIKTKVITFYSSLFPRNYLKIRDKLKEKGIIVYYLQPNQVRQKLLKYDYV